MIQNSVVYLSIVAALLLGVVCIITTEIDGSEFVIVRSDLAQTASTSSGNMNMTTPMMESASFHLRAADRL
jgi:hypothetical protein